MCPGTGPPDSGVGRSVSCPHCPKHAGYFPSFPDAAGVLAAATEAGESADALFAHAVAQLATFVGFEP
jgi:hypothetical protein